LKYSLYPSPNTLKSISNTNIEKKARFIRSKTNEKSSSIGYLSYARTIVLQIMAITMNIEKYL
jgi:hypothetical protein